MTLSDDIRQLVRKRANFACEFCGISETDAGGELTVDHFQPLSKSGDDKPDNLIYCCQRCNQYKLDYWPVSSQDPLLWNPRIEPRLQHFIELDDGTLHPLTSVGDFSLRRLRLNRPPLIANRLRKRQEIDTHRLLAHLRDLTEAIDRLLVQQSQLMEEQQRLLEQQRFLLQLLLQNAES